MRDVIVIALVIGLFFANAYFEFYQPQFSEEPSRPPRHITSSTLPIKQKWQAEIDASVSTSPIIADNTVVVPTRMALYGLDIISGQQRWKHNSGPHPSPPPIIVVNSTVVYGEGKDVFALDELTGGVVWQHQIKSGDLRSIVANENVVFVVAQPTHIEAIDLETGELIWSLNGYENGMETRGAVLFLDGNDLYLFTTEGYILDTETGKIKRVVQQNLRPAQLYANRFYSSGWIRETETLSLITDLYSPSSKDFTDTCENFKVPYTFWGNQFFAVGKCGGVYALDQGKKWLKWKYREDLVGESPLAIYQDKLYVLFGNGEIHAINLETGQEEGILKTDLDLMGYVKDADFSSRGIAANENILIATFNDKSVWTFCEEPCN